MGTQVKGQVFTSALAALERLQGPQVTAQLVAALEGDFGHAMRTRSVLAIGWYPLEWYAQLHTAARARCGAAISGPIGRESSIADINTVFRYILKLFSPETLLGQAPRIFHTYCRGDLVLDSSEKGRVRAHCEKCDGANQGGVGRLGGELPHLPRARGSQEPPGPRALGRP